MSPGVRAGRIQINWCHSLDELQNGAQQSPPFSSFELGATGRGPKVPMRFQRSALSSKSSCAAGAVKMDSRALAGFDVGRPGTGRKPRLLPSNNSFLNKPMRHHMNWTGRFSENDQQRNDLTCARICSKQAIQNCELKHVFNSREEQMNSHR